MRVHVASDEHYNIDFNKRIVRPVDCDLVICAGDAGPPLRESLKWFAKSFPAPRKIYTPGNHDYYSFEVKDHPELKTTYERERAEAQAVARDLGIDLLDTGTVVIDRFRFIGATLWSDFMSRPSYMSFPEAQRAAMVMNDYRKIKVGKGRGGDRLLPRDTISAHKADVKFITEQLAIPFDGETVVVTHHAPSERSLMGPDGSGSGRVGANLDWCYASALDYLMMDADTPEAVARGLTPDHTPPSMWIHGHIHQPQDYEIGSCRVLANPRGYPKLERANAPRENPAFDDQLVIEIGRDLTLRPGM
jgi:predicted phosphodiesterase